MFSSFGLLAGPTGEVFGVGDDGPDDLWLCRCVAVMLIDFVDLFPGSTTHDLHVNYRCPPAVVEAASTLLTHNRRRIDKRITHEPGRKPEKLDFEISRNDDPLAATIDRVTSLVESGVHPADIAVLTRVNATLLGPMLLLGEAGIATSAPVDSNFLERTGIAGAIAWLRVAVAPEQALPPPRSRRRSDGHLEG